MPPPYLHTHTLTEAAGRPNMGIASGVSVGPNFSTTIGSGWFRNLAAMLVGTAGTLRLKSSWLLWYCAAEAITAQVQDVF